MKTYFLCLTTFFSFLFLTGNAENKQEKTLYFETASYTLTSQQQTQLNTFLSSFKTTGVKKAEVSGHTDNIGSNAFNQTLSKKRALYIKDALTRKGINNELIKIAAYGLSQPIADNSNADGQSKNRRAEVVIYLKDGKKLFLNYENKASEFYRIDATKPSVVEGSEGTKINIPANALVTPDGKPAKNVKIELKEFYSKSDLLMTGLHTTSNGQLLESGGTIYVNATNENGEELQLKPGAMIDVEFNSANEGEGMEIFYGEETEDGFDWKQPVESSETETSVSEDIMFNNVDFLEKSETLTDEEFERLNKKSKANYKKYKEVNSLLLRSNKLKWINCDRFYGTRNNTKLTIKTDSMSAPVYIVFKDINSIMSSYFLEKNTASFYRTPIGAKATIVSYQWRNNEFVFASKDITITRGMTVDLDFKEVTEDELKKELKRIN